MSVSAADDIGLYLKGSMNGWIAKEEYRFVHEGDGIYTLVLSMDGGVYNYKIGTENWSVSMPDGPDNAELELGRRCNH